MDFSNHEMTTDDPKINIRKQKHVDRKTNSSFKCKLCGEDSFDTKLSFKKHMSEIHGGKYECLVCNLHFISSNKLKQHESKVHDINSFQCPICQSVLSTRKTLKDHIDTVHEKKRPYTCSTCGKSFGTTMTRNKHMRTHIEKELHKCPNCTFECKLRISMKKHIAVVHEGQDPTPKFYCDLCVIHKKFPKDLRRHIEKVHEGKKYQCTICQEDFTSEFRLSSHKIKTHLDLEHQKEVIHKCSKCEATYLHKSTLARHFLEQHQRESLQIQICPHCAKTFNNSSQLNVHVRGVHEKVRQECKVCNKTFSTKGLLRRHTEHEHEGKKPQFQCSMCPLIVKGTMTSLKRHVEIVHENIKRYVCTICKAKFGQSHNLKAHISGVHEGAKPFECKFCEKRLSSKQLLNHHIKRIHGREKMV